MIEAASGLSQKQRNVECEKQKLRGSSRVCASVPKQASEKKSRKKSKRQDKHSVLQAVFKALLVKEFQIASVYLKKGT